MTTPTPHNFRALCAELADSLEAWQRGGIPTERLSGAGLVARARAALKAQPEPAGPTDEELRQVLLDCGYHPGNRHLISLARAVLARWGRPAALPVPVGPTEEELLRTYGGAKRDHCYDGPIDDWPKRAERAATVHGLRAVLARWGRPAIEPIPVSERPWNREGWCDAEGKCWWGHAPDELCNPDWFLATRAEVDDFCDAYPPVVSLPHYALPIPRSEEK